MPTKKPLPRLPKWCPLCRGMLTSRACYVCAYPLVSCPCTSSDHDYKTTKRSAATSWLARIAAKRKVRKAR